MKKAYLFLLLLSCFAISAQAQETCTPDPSLLDSVGVFPLPFDAVTNPTGGIQIPACIGEYYEFTFTVSNSDTLLFSGFPLVLPYVRLDSLGGAITGLPVGLNFVCNPPNCVFEYDSVGCVKIFGIPNAANSVGAYNLLINGFIPFGFGETSVTFPGAIFPGSYTLNILANGDPACVAIGAEDIAFAAFSALQPNPASSDVTLKLNSVETGAANLSIATPAGQIVLREAVNLQLGTNELHFDVAGLPNGLYFVTVNKAGRQITTRLSVHHL